MTRLALTLPAAVAALAVGCSGPAAPAPTPASLKTAAAPVEQIENLDYANWSRFKPGTTIVRRSVSERDGIKTTSVETYRLAEVGPDRLAVERQNTTQRDGESKVVNPAGRLTHVKSFGLPAGMSADDFRKPARKAELTGEESVTVLGKEYKAKVYKWTDGTEAGPMAVTVWLADELPGRIARQVMTVEKLKTTTTEEVVELRVNP